jgi:PhnB protein
MTVNELTASKIKYALAPWISFPSAPLTSTNPLLIAKEVYRHDDHSGGVVVRLSVNGAEFWLSQESPEPRQPYIPGPIGGGTIRMILTVPKPMKCLPAL